MSLGEPEDGLRFTQQVEQARREQRVHQRGVAGPDRLRPLLTDLQDSAQERLPTRGDSAQVAWRVRAVGAHAR